MSTAPILLTGASGFIGRRLRQRLLGSGADVLSLRRPASPAAPDGRSVELDYGDATGLAAMFARERPRVVLHVAGVTKGVRYDDFVAGNVAPTRALLEALVQAGHRPERFVHVSSLAAYGPSNEGAPLGEDAEPRPIEYYGQSKLEAEQVVAAFAEQVPATIIRPGGVYGPGDVDYFEYFRQAARGLNVFFGNRARRMSVVYVDDLVDVILAASEAPAAAGRGYFISDGAPVSFEAFQGEIVRQAGRKVRDLDLPEFLVGLAASFGELLTALDKKPRLFNHQKAAMGRQEAWTCEPVGAARDLGFAPKVDLAEGVGRSWAWYREQGWV